MRYCVECQPIIEEEYKSRREKYIPIPRIEVMDTWLQPPNANLSPDNNEDKETYTEKQTGVLLHTKTTKSHAYQNLTEDADIVVIDRPKVSVGGRPKKDVPIKLIHRLANKKLSIKQIVKELKEREGKQYRL